MKKFLSILCVVLLSCVSLFAAALLDDDPRKDNGNKGNSPLPRGLVTEGGGRNTGPGGPVQSVVIPLTFDPCYTVNLGLGFCFDGTPEFMLFFSQSFQSTENIEFVNMKTGNRYYGVLAAGATSCWVNVADVIGPWMVCIGSRVTYFTITSEFYNSNLMMH